MAPRAALLLAVWLTAAVPEPAGYWTGAMQGQVPATLAGATVLADAPAARAWIAARHPVILDVAAAPRRPPAMAPGAPWLPAAHQGIAGSVWLPDAGRAVLTTEGAEAYRRAVERLAGPPPGRPLLAYCHPNCWGSWNAAKALVQTGYTQVAWFPGGLEAWSHADYPLQQTPAPQPN